MEKSKSSLKRFTKWAKKNGISLPMDQDRIFKLKKLDVKYKGLTDIDESIFILSDLEVFDASNNRLTALPDSLVYCYQLKSLDLRRNNIENYPPKLSKFKVLEELSLGGNSIKRIPEEILELKKLRVLNLPNNLVEELPDFIGQMKTLEELNLSGNKISKLPESIGELENLKKLDLWSNKLTYLPESLGNLKNLEELNIWSNDITEIPESISALPKLKRIELKISQAELDRKLFETVCDDDFMQASELIKMGANVNFKCDDCPDFDVSTPLFEARSVDMVRLLLDNNADTSVKREKKGKLSIKVWETDDKHTGEYETFLTKKHSQAIKDYLKAEKLI